MNMIRVLVMMLALSLIPLGAQAESSVYALQVDGLSCPFCTFGIEKKLYSVEGVQDIAVDLEQGVVVVTMEEGSMLSEVVARKKVKDAGFTLRGFTRRAKGARHDGDH